MYNNLFRISNVLHEICILNYNIQTWYNNTYLYHYDDDNYDFTIYVLIEQSKYLMCIAIVYNDNNYGFIIDNKSINECTMCYLIYRNQGEL